MHCRKIFKIVLCVCLALIVSLGTVFSTPVVKDARAESISSMKDKLNSLESEKAQIKSKMDSLQNDIDQKQAYLDTVNSYIATVESKITTCENLLATYEAEIADFNKEIEKKESVDVKTIKAKANLDAWVANFERNIKMRQLQEKYNNNGDKEE